MHFTYPELSDFLWWQSPIFCPAILAYGRMIILNTSRLGGSLSRSAGYVASHTSTADPACGRDGRPEQAAMKRSKMATSKAIPLEQNRSV